jgi:membrane complex biogenesis BtpA family protein
MNDRLPPSWSGLEPVIGMVHLRPLPGSPRFPGGVDPLRAAALRDAEALAEGGVDGLLVENFGDAPFYPDRVPPHTVSWMTALAVEIRRATDLPLGINVLRNDAVSALAVAHAAGGSFVRVNVLSGARLTDQGILQGRAHEVLRARRETGAEAVAVLADVDVKHSAPLAPRDLELEVHELVTRCGADGIIVSGAGTGRPVDPEELLRAGRAAGGTPVFAGSGVTPETIEGLAGRADGFIVGTWFKKDGRVEAPVEAARVRELVSRLRP